MSKPATAPIIAPPAPETAPAAAADNDSTAKSALENLMASLFGQAQGSDNGIGGFIMGFLKFLFESFFPSKDAPDEDPGDANRPAPSVGDVVRMGKVVVDSHAIPKWREFQQKHKGEAVTYINPVAGGFKPISRDFGMHMHPIYHEERMHTGADLKPQIGSNPDALAAANGIVLWSGWKSGYGNTIMIGHADGSYTLYGHLRGDKMAAIGSEVTQGQIIGVVGQTGGATGPHLHFEERKGDKPVQPQIGGVALVDGVSQPGYTGQTPSPRQPTTTPHAHLAKPHVPAPTPTVQQQVASLALSTKLQVADAYEGTKNALSQGMHNARVTMGNILG